MKFDYIVHVPDFEWSIHGRLRLLATLLLQVKYLQEEQNFSFLKIVLNVTNLKIVISTITIQIIAYYFIFSNFSPLLCVTEIVK